MGRFWRLGVGRRTQARAGESSSERFWGLLGPPAGLLGALGVSCDALERSWASLGVFGYLLGRHWVTHDGPRSYPTGSQDTPRGSRTTPRSSQETPRGAKRRPRGAERPPRSPKRLPRGAKNTPRGPQEASRGAKRLPRGSQEAPRGAKRPPRGPQEPPKSLLFRRLLGSGTRKKKRSAKAARVSSVLAKRLLGAEGHFEATLTGISYFFAPPRSSWK